MASYENQKNRSPMDTSDAELHFQEEKASASLNTRTIIRSCSHVDPQSRSIQSFSISNGSIDLTWVPSGIEYPHVHFYVQLPYCIGPQPTTQLFVDMSSPINIFIVYEYYDAASSNEWMPDHDKTTVGHDWMTVSRSQLSDQSSNRSTCELGNILIRCLSSHPGASVANNSSIYFIANSLAERIGQLMPSTAMHRRWWANEEIHSPLHRVILTGLPLHDQINTINLIGNADPNEQINDGKQWWWTVLF